MSHPSLRYLFSLTAAFCGLFLTPPPLPAQGPGATGDSSENALPDDRKLWLQLQIFLDDAEFNPGKLDGYWGMFTEKALEAWLKAQGRADEIPESWPEEGPENAGELADLASIHPVLTTYTIKESDPQMIGDLPEDPEQKAEQGRLPYTSLWELVAEMYHSDPELLAELNPDLVRGSLKVGDTLTVPNVGEPFDLQALNKEQQEKKKKGGDQDQDQDNQGEEQTAAADESEVPREDLVENPRIIVDKVNKELMLFSGDKLVAFAPITPGAADNPAPTGDWHITGIAWMPTFRYDEDMLKHGRTSDDYHIFPPGANNPVGVIWMAINSEGIGLHGTKAPDTIGRTSSHGCVRMSNWDAWTIGRRVKARTPVQIVEGWDGEISPAE